MKIRIEHTIRKNPIEQEKFGGPDAVCDHCEKPLGTAKRVIVKSEKIKFGQALVHKQCAPDFCSENDIAWMF